MLPSLTLVLGGAASGKSAFAENLLISSGLQLVYVATARVWDAEMEHKIKLHKSRRDTHWVSIEAPIEVGQALAEAPSEAGVLLDCATMWLSNLMMEDAALDAAPERFLAELARARGPVVVVSNEVGQGIVPDNQMARAFREAQGRLNIAVAAQADTVVQVVAGLPNVLKGQLA